MTGKVHYMLIKDLMFGYITDACRIANVRLDGRVLFPFSLSDVAISFANSVAQCGCNLVMEDRPCTCQQVD